ncbi:MAG: hypothetical protein ACU0C9_08135 [Paracoccaceae bacterium]
MNWLIWPGAIVAVLGIVGLIFCIRAAAKARSENLDSAAMEARLHQLVAMNMGALAVSSIGLMMVVIGILLG